MKRFWKSPSWMASEFPRYGILTQRTAAFQIARIFGEKVRLSKQEWQRSNPAVSSHSLSGLNRIGGGLGQRHVSLAPSQTERPVRSERHRQRFAIANHELVGLNSPRSRRAKCDCSIPSGRELPPGGRRRERSGRSSGRAMSSWWNCGSCFAVRRMIAIQFRRKRT